MDQVQSAFIKNCYILDNVACANEILATLHDLNIEAVFLKLLRRFLINLVGTSYLSYYWQEDLGNVESVGLKCVAFRDIIDPC